MARKRFDEMNCPAALALDQIGDWWTLLLVREAYYGVEKFSSFQERLGIARNILADRLERLVGAGIFERVPERPGADRMVYRLTAKGEDLLPVIVALVQWGDRWICGPGKEPILILDHRSKTPIAPLRICAADGRALSLADLRFRPGPGASRETLARFAEARRARA
jgi:DNA-binding HxlR family transcriptional regulator